MQPQEIITISEQGLTSGLFFGQHEELIREKSTLILKELNGLTPYQIDLVFDRVRTIIRDDIPVMFHEIDGSEWAKKVS